MKEGNNFNNTLVFCVPPSSRQVSDYFYAPVKYEIFNILAYKYFESFDLTPVILHTV
jgi:hypothetical protein